MTSFDIKKDKFIFILPEELRKNNSTLVVSTENEYFVKNQDKFYTVDITPKVEYSKIVSLNERDRKLIEISAIDYILTAYVL